MFKVDYLKFTWKNRTNKKQRHLYDYICENDYVTHKKQVFSFISDYFPFLEGYQYSDGCGISGYPNTLRFFNNDLIIAYGRISQGIHVQMSGKFLDNFRDYVRLILDILVISEDILITRVDFAHDLEINFSYFLDKVRKGHYLTRARNVKKVYSNDKYKKDSGTLYFGSRTSDTYIRIYDKGLEQKTDIKNWTRIELELKYKDKNKTKMTIKEYINDKMIIQKILLDNLIFINEKGKNKNGEVLRMDRVKPNKKYLQLINNETGERLKIKTAIDKDDNKYLDYMEKQVLSQAKAFIEVYGQTSFDRLLKHGIITSEKAKQKLTKLREYERKHLKLVQ